MAREAKEQGPAHLTPWGGISRMIEARAVAERALRYLDTASVVGFEEPFVRLLHTELTAMGCQVERRTSLLAAVGGPATISAHIDRHGFLTAEGGRLRHAASALVGRPPSRSLAAAICARSVNESVYAYDPVTGTSLAEATVRHAAHCGQGPAIDAVALDLADIAPGTPVAFTNTGSLDRGWLRGQIDNTLCVALVMEHLADGFDGTVLFTEGEEAGRSWQALATWFVQPNSDLIVLDTSPFDDSGPATEGAVVLRRADAGASFNPETTRRLADAAEGHPVVWKDQHLAAAGKSLGRTELGRVVSETQGRVSGSTLQIPTTDYHTNHEATTLAAIQSAADVLSSLRRTTD